MSVPRRQYRNPPVEEVLCIFEFPQSCKWDASLPGELYSKISDEFPNKRPGKQYNLQVEIGPEAAASTIGSRDIVSFFAKDNRFAVQVMPFLLAVAHFPGGNFDWDEYRRVVSRVSASFGSLSEVTAASINLVFRNRICLPGSVVSIEEYLEFFPYSSLLVKRPELQVSGFIAGLQLQQDESEALRMTITGLPKVPSEDMTPIMLEIAYIALQPPNLEPLLERAEERLSDAFESCITDKTRELFGGVH